MDEATVHIAPDKPKSRVDGPVVMAQPTEPQGEDSADAG